MSALPLTRGDDPTRADARTTAASEGSACAARANRPSSLARLAPAATAALALWITVVLFVAWPLHRFPVISSDSNIDAAFFAEAGQLVRAGGVPYVAFWDHKPPLIFLIDALALTASGGSLWGLWGATLLALVGSVVLAYRALRRAFGAGGALLGVVCFACSLPLAFASNLTEIFAVPLQWGSVLLLAHWSRRDERTFRTGVWLGLLAILAFLLKQNLIGAMASVGIVLTILLLADRRVAAWLRLVAGVLVGAGVVSVAVAAYFAHAGAMRPFVEEVFRYNVLYAEMTTWGLRIRAAMDGLLLTTAYGSFVIPCTGWVVAIAAIATRWRRDPRLPWMLLAAIWLPIEVALAATAGRPYAHYFTPVLAPVAFLTALAAAELLTRMPASDGSRTSWSARAVIVAAGVIACVAIGRTSLDLRDNQIPAKRHAQLEPTVAWISRHTPAGAPILVWGHAADVYLLSGHAPATRFLYVLPLLTPGYADSAVIARFLDDVKATRPPLIIDASNNSLADEKIAPPLDRFDPTWRFPIDGAVRWWATTPPLRAVYDYLHATYAPVAVVGPWKWRMYERLDARGSADASAARR